MNILKFSSLSKKSFALVALLSVALPFAVSGQAKALDTLSLRRGEALSTNNNTRSRLHGQPRMTVSRHDVYNRDQQFSVQDMGGGTVRLRHASTNKCLNAYNPRRGSLVNVWTCENADMDQRFIKVQVGNRVLLKSKNDSRFCLDASHVERGLVHLYDCNPNNENQLWRINPIVNNPAHNLPSVVTIVNKNTNSMMDGGANRGGEVYGHSEHLKNSYQQWELRRVGNYFMLINKQTGRALDAGGGSVNNSQMDAYMHPTPMSHNDYHLWRIESNGAGQYLIISKATGFALDGGGANVGQDSIYLFQRPNRYNSWHQWKIEGVDGGNNSGESWINPLPGYRVTSEFGYRDESHLPGNGDNWHNGIDIGTNGARPAIKAVNSGTVVLVESRTTGYGNRIAIQHADGTRSYYSHLSRIRVSMRQRVNQGDIIGNVGSTGDSTGPHLHLEIRRGPNYRYRTDSVNPRQFIRF